MEAGYDMTGHDVLLKNFEETFKNEITPLCCADADQVQKNCQRMLDTCRKNEVKLRPHTKTHKTKHIVNMQVADQTIASGVVVSTMAEAKLYLDVNSVKSITYGVPVNIGHMAALRSLATNEQEKPFFVLIDTEAQIKALAADGKANGWQPHVFFKVDCGYHRAGRYPGEMIDDHFDRILRALAEARGVISVVGVYAHSGHSYDAAGDLEFVADIGQTEVKRCIEVTERMRQFGGISMSSPFTVTVGATPTAAMPHWWQDARAITGGLPDVQLEFHPGNYVFFDRQQAKAGSCALHDAGLFVVTRVISHYPERKQILIDAGGLALSRDAAGFIDWGAFIGSKDHGYLKLVRLSQEVGVVTYKDNWPRLQERESLEGLMLAIIPNHACYVGPLHGKIHLCRQGKEVEVLKPCSGWQ
eukprot:Clim_evm8s146 gene=Clim_evmTU8s146